MFSLSPNLMPTFTLPGPSVIRTEADAEELWERIRHGHGHDTCVGYIVRRTYFNGRPHEDVEVYGPTSYGPAVELAHRVREEQGRDGYAVIDRIYSCGCRELG